MAPGAEHDDDQDRAGGHPADEVPRTSERAPAASRDRQSGVPDPRAHAAWRSWLSALARDAEVALAAALTYEALAPEARDAWLDALDADAPAVAVPSVALYAPLLGVEEEEGRRGRILAAIGDTQPVFEARALRGRGPGDEVVLLVVLPVYLEFVEVLACRMVADGGLLGATHEPLVGGAGFYTSSVMWEGLALSEVPMRDAVEELAHAIVADRRDGRTAPDVLRRFVDLFDACA